MLHGTPPQAIASEAPRARAPEPISLERRISGRAVLVPLALFLLVVVVMLWPTLRWAYHVERAGTLLDAGLAWPTPRRADSLPRLVDNQALSQALVHLERAQRIRPNDAHAYRLAGYAYAAQGAWSRAIASFNRAHVLVPGNPVLPWETSLIYEQIEQLISHVPHSSIMTELATGEVSVDQFRVYAPYCYPGQTQRCYVEEATIVLPFSAFPQGPVQRERALLVYDQAVISVTLQVPQEQPALTFLAGIAPGRTQLTQPATYTIALAQPGLPASQIFTATLTSAAARRGWQIQSVDLSVWAGQVVTLGFVVQSAQSYKDRAERYVWADVEFTSVAAARYGVMMPTARKVRAWREAGLGAAQFIARGDEARSRRGEKEAQLWYQRAEVISLP